MDNKHQFRKTVSEIKTRPVFGLPVAAITRQDAAAQVIRWAKQGDQARGVEAADAHVVTRARHEEAFGACMRKFSLICPDGMPVLWTVNRQLPKEEQLEERVSGAELMEETFAQTEDEPEVSHFLLGGSEKMLKTLQQKLGERFPKAKIAGVYSPPFGQWPEDEFERICGRIRESGASLIWVGLGCPKQERWIGEHMEQLPAGCYFGVGAAFAFHAGMVQRAPQIFQKTGMEWFYRLCKEPRRLWKRYFTYNSLFLYYTFIRRGN